MTRVVNNYGMLSVNIVRIQDKNLWIFRRRGQLTNRFSEVIEIAAGSRSEVYQALFFGWGLLTMGRGGRSKAGLTPSTGKGPFN